MERRLIISLEKSLEASNRAQAFDGPKNAIFLFCAFAFSFIRSSRPKHRGISGPAITRSIEAARAKSASSSILSAFMGTFSPKRAVPPFPGAIKSLPREGDSFSFKAIACSLPPDPTSSMFIFFSKIRC